MVNRAFRESADKAWSLGGEETTKPPLTNLGLVKDRSWR